MVDESGDPLRKPNGNPLNLKWSTFWPDDWTLADVESAVAEAYHDARFTLNGLDGKRFFGFAGPIPVEGWLDDSGRIVTAYPFYPEH